MSRLIPKCQDVIELLTSKDVSLSFHKINAYLHVRKLDDALCPQPLGMRSSHLYLRLHKLLSVKMCLLSVPSARGITWFMCQAKGGGKCC